MEGDSRNSREESYYQNATLEQPQSRTPSDFQSESWLDPVPVQPSWRQKRHHNFNSSLPQVRCLRDTIYDHFKDLNLILGKHEQHYSNRTYVRQRQQ